MLYLALYISPISFSPIRAKKNPHQDYSRWGGVEILSIYIYLRRLPNCVLPDRAYTTEAVGTTRFASALIS